jgi:type IV secretion system protein VirB4
VIGFCSQSAQDARGSHLASSIIEQAKTQIWLPNPQALEEVCCGTWKLTPEEFNRVQSTPLESRCFLLKQGAESAMVRLDLSGMRDLLPVLAGDLATVRRVEALRAQVGEDPAAWLPLLCGRAEKEGLANA